MNPVNASITALRAVSLATAFAAIASIPAAAQPVLETQQHVMRVADVMTALAPESALAGLTIREIYRPYFDALALMDYSGIQRGLGDGGLVTIPGDPRRFNIELRL